jgi:hypothetical protein
MCLCLNLVGCKKQPPKPYDKFVLVEGYVKDAIDSTSIFGAEILLGVLPDTIFVTRTDSMGYYNFADFPGRKDVTAKAVGYETQTKTVQIEENQIQLLDFLLERKE